MEFPSVVGAVLFAADVPCGFPSPPPCPGVDNYLSGQVSQSASRDGVSHSERDTRNRGQRTVNMPNPPPAHLMSPVEHRAELCTILARGLVRLKLRMSTAQSAGCGESSLHFAGGQSGHATPTKDLTQYNRFG